MEGTPRFGLLGWMPNLVSCRKAARTGYARLACQILCAWKQSRVAKTLIYSGHDVDVCIAVEDGVIGVNLPPLDACANARCQCYWPWDASKE
jgi:hypothetical protein